MEGASHIDFTYACCGSGCGHGVALVCLGWRDPSDKKTGE